MTTLDKLSEQTQFILSKQLETKKYFMDVFQDFLSSVLDENTNFEKAGQKNKAAKLQEIHDLAAGQMDRVNDELTKDIEYLEGNIEAVNKIKQEKDIAKRNELVNLLLEDQELPETEQLKIDVEAEIEASKEDFSFLLGDLKAALAEGEIDDVLASLRNMETGISVSDEENEDDEEGVDIFNLRSREDLSEDEDEDDGDLDDEDDYEDYEDDEDYDDEDECCDEDEEEDDECCRKKSSCCDEDEEEDDESCCGSFPKKGLSGCCRD